MFIIIFTHKFTIIIIRRLSVFGLAFRVRIEQTGIIYIKVFIDGVCRGTFRYSWTNIAIRIIYLILIGILIYQSQILYKQTMGNTFHVMRKGASEFKLSMKLSERFASVEQKQGDRFLKTFIWTFFMSMGLVRYVLCLEWLCSYVVVSD